MNIRRANLKDSKNLDKINKQYFGEHRDYEEEIADKNTVVLIAEENNKIVGISGYKINSWNSTAWLLNIFAHPKFRRQGIGTDLIGEIIKEVRKSKLRCLMAEAPSESDAPSLFKSFGFRKCGYNDRYYSNNPGEIAEFWSYDT